MEEKTIQSIPVIPLALMMAYIGGVIGLIIGVIYAVVFGAIFSAIFSSLPYNSGSITAIPSFFGLIFGVGALIICPKSGFVGGLIQGALIVAISIPNFLATKIGGIKLRFKED